MQGDPSLEDEQLKDEIDLVGALVLAASETEGALSTRSIDEILGVDPDAETDADDAAEGADATDEADGAGGGTEPPA